MYSNRHRAVGSHICTRLHRLCELLQRLCTCECIMAAVVHARAMMPTGPSVTSCHMMALNSKPSTAHIWTLRATVVEVCHASLYSCFKQQPTCPQPSLSGLYDLPAQALPMLASLPKDMLVTWLMQQQ